MDDLLDDAVVPFAGTRLGKTAGSSRSCVSREFIRLLCEYVVM